MLVLNTSAKKSTATEIKTDQSELINFMIEAKRDLDSATSFYNDTRNEIRALTESTQGDCRNSVKYESESGKVGVNKRGYRQLGAENLPALIEAFGDLIVNGLFNLHTASVTPATGGEQISTASVLKPAKAFVTIIDRLLADPATAEDAAMLEQTLRADLVVRVTVAK